MQNTSGIRPLDLAVLVLPDRAKDKSAGGIFIPDAVKDRDKFAVVKGTLIEAGPNAFAEWGEGNGPEQGSRVYTAQYAGARAKGADGEEYTLMKDADIVAVFTEEANG